MKMKSNKNKIHSTPMDQFPLPANKVAGPSLKVRRKSLVGHIILFLAISILYLATLSDHHFGKISDGVAMIQTAVAMHEFGELKIYQESEAKSASYTGHYVKYGLGFPLVLQIPLTIISVFGASTSQLIFSLTNLLLTSLTACLVSMCLVKMGFPFFPIGVASALGFAFGSCAWPYISLDFSEPLQACCLAAAFLFALRSQHTTGHSQAGLILSSFFIGFAILTKALSLIVLPGFIFYILFCPGNSWSQRLRSLFWFLLPLVAWGVVMAGLNAYRFGSPFNYGYGGESKQFTTPLLSGLYYLLLSPTKGLVFFAPLCLLSAWMGFKLFKNHRAEILTAAIIAVSLLVPSAMWWSWEGGSSWGPRLLLPALPFLLLWAGAAWGTIKWGKPAFVLLLMIGIGVNLLGVLIHFSAWPWIISAGGKRFALNAQGRPASEYIEKDGKKHFVAFVAANYIPALSQIRGHAWLLGIRYFSHPVSIDAIASRLVTHLSPNPALGIQFDIENNQVQSGLLYYLQSAHFWWEKYLFPSKEPNATPILGQALMLEGEKATANKNMTRAIHCYQKSLAISPNSFNTALKLANSYFQTGDPANGIKIIADFSMGHPQIPDPILIYAYLLEQSGQKTAALTEYQRFQIRFPNHPQIPNVRQKIVDLSTK
jgi:hypothetical protein